MIFPSERAATFADLEEIRMEVSSRSSSAARPTRTWAR